ncbi:hypothetical protein GE061_015118 [Apolygus lucorum]|uniref:Pupal cuticle protein n=1 Tax=Apolygus lucorum TaxID=248454 RepID=A0A8S9XM47_APOLU|nr:hypothetical protein GE061_015118 [Apolygus lucorum]
MKTLVVLLSMIGVGIGFPSWGLPQPVQDEPEVTAAKKAHIAALAEAISLMQSLGAAQAVSGPEDDGSWKGDGLWKQHDDGSWKDDTQTWKQQQSEKKWTGPVALPPGYDKHGAPLQVLDTPEVSAAKSKHFHLYSYAAAKAAPPKHH